MPDDLHFWEQQADTFDEFIGEEGDPLRSDILDPFIMSQIAPKQTDRILDAGCGNGYFCRKLSPLIESVTGIDGSKRMIEIAEERSDAYKNISYQLQDLTESNWKLQKEFSCVLAHLILQDMSDIEAFFIESKRLLAKNGRLFITIPHPFTSPPVGYYKLGLPGRLGLHSGYLKTYNYLEERKARRSIYLAKGLHHNYYHRTISTYISTALKHNFTLSSFKEIGTNRQFTDTYPAYKHGLHIPIFLYLAFTS